MYWFSKPVPWNYGVFSKISNQSVRSQGNESKVTTEDALIKVILKLKVPMNQVTTKNPAFGIFAGSWPVL